MRTLIPSLSSRTLLSALVFLAFAFGGVIAPAFAQDAPQPPATPTDQAAATAPLPVIKTESRIVLVDAVVTDKKGKYIRDLTQQDFRVFEDNKEQVITSFSFGADPTSNPNGGQKDYLVLFFDNSSMDRADQIQARGAAKKFIEKNASPDRLMAIAEFGGSLRIKQNFTSNSDQLQAAVTGAQTPHLETNPQADSQSVLVASNSPILPGSLGSAEADLGARSMLLSIRSLAKNLRSIPGRKMLVLFSAGFPLDAERMSELTATIDACNKANVAIYSLDVRGLTASAPGGSAYRQDSPSRQSSTYAARKAGQVNHPRLVLARYSLSSADPDPQKPGGGGGTSGGGGGGRPSGGGGGTPGGGVGGSGGSKGGTGGTGGGTTGGGKGTTGGGSSTGGGRPTNSPTFYNSNNPLNQPRTIIPQMPSSVTTNQQILQALAEGTGGFAIYNTNDLLGGLDRIAREQNEFYILGYVPQASTEGSCHTLKVKLNKGGTEVRSRSGYCNARPTDPLVGKPLEKQMEIQAKGSQAGSIQGYMQAPYFYSGPNTARISLAMDIPGDSLNFNKEKGKYHSNLNVLGIAYRPDGSVGARFSDTLDLNLEKDEWKDLTKDTYHYQNQFDAAPGTYKLTVVLSAGGEHFGKFETPLTIAPYDGKKLALGGIVLSTNMQRVDQISTEVDSTLLEDRTPLIVKGMQITPAAKYQFKKTDNAVVYSQLYAPLLTTDTPPKVGAGYRIFDKSNKEVVFTGGIALDDFVQKGNAVVPFGLKLQIKDLQAGTYRLVLMGVDGANNQAIPQETQFAVTD